MQMGKKGPRWAQKHQTPANFDKTLPPVTEESGSESSFDDEHPGAWARQNPEWRDIYGCESPRIPPGDWGAQEDAERLDIGPSAGLSFRIGAARGRVSADYRFRVAGDAEPSSGPALTLTAGF